MSRLGSSHHLNTMQHAYTMKDERECPLLHLPAMLLVTKAWKEERGNE